MVVHLLLCYLPVMSVCVCVCVLKCLFVCVGEKNPSSYGRTLSSLFACGECMCVRMRLCVCLSVCLCVFVFVFVHVFVCLRVYVCVCERERESFHFLVVHHLLYCLPVVRVCVCEYMNV